MESSAVAAGSIPAGDVAGDSAPPSASTKYNRRSASDAAGARRARPTSDTARDAAGSRATGLAASAGHASKELPPPDPRDRATDELIAAWSAGSHSSTDGGNKYAVPQRLHNPCVKYVKFDRLLAGPVARPVPRSEQEEACAST